MKRTKEQRLSLLGERMATFEKRLMQATPCTPKDCKPGVACVNCEYLTTPEEDRKLEALAAKYLDTAKRYSIAGGSFAR